MAVSIVQSVSLSFVLTGIFTETVSSLTDMLADSKIALASFADSLSGNFGDSAKFQGTQSVPALSFNLDDGINHKSSNSWHLSSDISLSPLYVNSHLQSNSHALESVNAGFSVTLQSTQEFRASVWDDDNISEIAVISEKPPTSQRSVCQRTFLRPRLST
jgi:hypothetical protein